MRIQMYTYMVLCLNIRACAGLVPAHWVRHKVKTTFAGARVTHKIKQPCAGGKVAHKVMHKDAQVAHKVR